MIAFLQGVIEEKQPTRLVMNVGGVGYEVLIPLSSFDRLPGAGQPARVLTYHHVREDAQQLFGFVSERERRLFLLLLSVSGIGPKLALSALSGLSTRELTTAIAQGDVKRLSTISGVGRKTAERMVVELRDKIGEAEALEAAAGAVEEGPETAVVRDAVLALIALGYKQDEARRLVRDAMGGEPPADAETLIRRALAR